MPEVHCMREAVYKKGINLELIVFPAILGLKGKLMKAKLEKRLLGTLVHNFRQAKILYICHSTIHNLKGPVIFLAYL
jgi:hypothetical protein